MTFELKQIEEGNRRFGTREVGSQVTEVTLLKLGTLGLNCWIGCFNGGEHTLLPKLGICSLYWFSLSEITDFWDLFSAFEVKF